jgi:4a-hydroxytetrahydrobiopterin dehydratase
VPCRRETPPATEDEILELKAHVPDWELVDVTGVKRLRRSFSFDDFAGALAFANRIGTVAEAEGHHPLLLIEWGRATVEWWTHSIGGLHRNDFVMAVKTDQILRQALR